MASRETRLPTTAIEPLLCLLCFDLELFSGPVMRAVVFWKLASRVGSESILMARTSSERKSTRLLPGNWRVPFLFVSSSKTAEPTKAACRFMASVFFFEYFVLLWCLDPDRCVRGFKVTIREALVIVYPKPFVVDSVGSFVVVVVVVRYLSNDTCLW